MPSPSRAGPEPAVLGGSAQRLRFCSHRRLRRPLAPGPRVPGSSFYHPFMPRIFFKGDPSWGAVWFQSGHPLGLQPAGAPRQPRRQQTVFPASFRGHSFCLASVLSQRFPSSRPPPQGPGAWGSFLVIEFREVSLL